MAKLWRKVWQEPGFCTPAARTAWEQGERDADALRAAALAIYAATPAVRLDYLSLAHPDTLEELSGPISHGLLSTAAWVGNVRLIDNVLLIERSA